MSIKAPEIVPQVAASPQKPKFEFGPSHTFRLRQHKGTPEFPSFNGLWELAMVDKNGKLEQILEDANDLTSCLDHIQGRFEEAGF